MPDACKKLHKNINVKKRRSNVKNNLQKSPNHVTKSKIQQDGLKIKSKSCQEIKKKFPVRDSENLKKNSNTLDDAIFQSLFYGNKNNNSPATDVDDYIRSFLLNSSKRNSQISSTDSSYSFDQIYQKQKSNKCYNPNKNPLDKLRYYPLTREDIVVNFKMSDDPPTVMENLYKDLALTDEENENVTDGEVESTEAEDEMEDSNLIRLIQRSNEEMGFERAVDNEDEDDDEDEEAEELDSKVIGILAEPNDKEKIKMMPDVDLDKFREEIEKQEDQRAKEQEILTSKVQLDRVKNKIEDTVEAPITDSAISQEMLEANEKSTTLQLEIKVLKSELKLLQNNEHLSTSDKQIFQQKHIDLMNKLGELDSLTRRIQQHLGLDDQSSVGAFGNVAELIANLELKTEEDMKSKIDSWKDWEATGDDQQFDFSQQSYPEDNVPRIIVCGHADDKFPKIVVADSHKKSDKHIENLQGRLSDALTVQENLARENEQLVGGKHILQIELSQRGNTVEILKQKVSNLQAEMRIIMNENKELSRKTALLNERIAYQSYSVNYSGNNSPRSPQLKNTNFQDPSTICNAFCATLNSSKKKYDDYNSKRLAGGGSFDNLCCSPLQSPPIKEKQSVYYRSATLNQRLVSPTRPNCPSEIDAKLMNYENNTKQLEQQLDTMESEVRHMKQELANTQRERQQLDQQSKLLKCTGPCAPCPCPNSGNITGSSGVNQGASTSLPHDDSPQINKKMPVLGTIPSCTGICANIPMGTSNCPLQELRDLREQYARLQEDYKNKLTEVSFLRTDMDKMKQEMRDVKDSKEKAANELIDVTERLKMFEVDRGRFHGSKEQMIEQEHTFLVTKQRYREAQDELEELRALIHDQADQLEDYRNKYLIAQEQVEEQRRQMELMEMDNARMNENVALEINRMKSQFQEKLSELAPLPEMLKQTQVKLQESQQMRVLAEKSCEELTRELLNCKDKIGIMTSQSEILRSENVLLKGPNSDQLNDLDNKNRELRNENERLKNAIARHEERYVGNKKKMEDKMHEIVQLSAMLEDVREDSARQVARTKERCDAVRRSMQGQINEMEKQLVQCRATAKAAQRDRDEIRQKMQGQINHLSETFDAAKSRVRNLQGHVNYLKTSYSNIFNTSTVAEEKKNVVLPSVSIDTPYKNCYCDN